MTFKAVGVAINMDDDTFEVPIAYIPPLPRNFYQCHPFYFISDPQKTQARFEHDVMNGKIPKDDIITIEAADEDGALKEAARIKKSSMMRSPAFSSFFKSKCYVHGCDMRLTFLVDPRSVFGALKVYLDMGPDYFTSEKLAAYVEANYEAFEGFLFFAKLYSLSKKLMLEVLADNIHKCLLETEDLIEPAHWYQLAATIFAESSACDKVLKDWCWGHIKKNAPTIQRLEDWITIDQDSNLGVKWMELKVSIKRKELEEREEEERQAAARLEARWARREALALAYLDRNPQVADMYFGGVRTGREGLRGERGGGRQKTTVELLWELEERRRAERRGLLGFLGKALQRR